MCVGVRARVYACNYVWVCVRACMYASVKIMSPDSESILYCPLGNSNFTHTIISYYIKSIVCVSVHHPGKE